RGHAAPSRGHQENGVEPRSERRGRLMEDGPGGRVNVVPAVVAGIGLTGCYAMMFPSRIADLAVDTVGVEVVPQPVKADIVGREHLFEVFEGKSLGLGFSGRL